MNSRYPLEALVALRESQREQALAALERAERNEQKARTERERAAERLRKHRERERARREREHEREVCFGYELQREWDYRERMQEEDQRLARVLAEAHRRHIEARRAVERARRELARASADREVAGRHRQRWSQAERTRAERANEEELGELWRPRHR